MNIKIQIDDYEIVNSGTIIIDNSKPLNFSFPDNNINFKIVFTEDPKIEYSKFDTKIFEEENYLEINIINSNSGQLVGNGGLVPLAKLNDRQLYLKFRVTNVGEENFDKIFNYTWYLKNE
jgi:hypothetical protein